jgi:hypothetical protein
MLKLCNSCNQEKPIFDFGKHSECRDGYRPYCKNCGSAITKAWRERNPEHRKKLARAYNRRRLEKNPNYGREWYKTQCDVRGEEFRAKQRVSDNKRRAAELNATPHWLDAIHKAQLQEFYDLAVARSTQTGVPHEVDHIIPINHKNVAGLHVPWNLQILTRKENRAKGNKLMQVTV